MADRYYYDKFAEVDNTFFNEPQFIIRVNFFLTKFLQKQRNLQYVYQDGFWGVYFSKKELRDVFGQKHYQKAIKRLEHVGFVERIKKLGKYNNKLFVFKELLLKPSETRVEIPIYFRRIVSSVDRYYTHRIKHLSESGKAQVANLRFTKIEISYGDFMKAVSDHYPEYVKEKEFEGKTPNTYERYIQVHQLLWNRIVEFNAAKGKAIYDFVSEDAFGNRFHSIITQLPRYIKELGVIKINNGTTVELDLHQSQPTILAHTLEEIQPGNDFSERIAEVDDIYVHMMEELNLNSRGEAKKVMFQMLFGRPFGKRFERFSEIFPEASTIMKSIKMRYDPTNPSKKRYSNLARLLQLSESEMFRKVWMALRKERIRFVSVHDSVIVESRNHSRAYQIMERVLSNYLDFFKIAG